MCVDVNVIIAMGDLLFCREAVDFLSNEGHIYSTIDENHFKSTDA